jgi:cation-transporting ATPase E
MEAKEKTIESEELRGLSTAEVEEQRALGNVNVVTEKVGKSYFEIIKDNLFTFFNFVWLVVAIMLIAIGSPGNLTFLFIVIPNILIAIIQEM